jgi:tetratricopeptide (TPR) repeat protein
MWHRLRERVGAELMELRSTAAEVMFEAELACGRHRDIIGELTSWVAESPFRERLVASLILALYRSGRHTESLTVYERTRSQLRDSLGLDPGPELQRLHGRILRHDTDLAATTAPTRVRQPSFLPRQLPSAPRAFSGRTAELANLSRLVTLPGLPTNTIVAISGPGGIGKTSLALYWAHQNLSRFPDGQLFANLRGFDPTGEPLTHGSAIRGLLDALGVPPPVVPTDPDAQIGLYRSLVADRRMLIVLDNARNSAQLVNLLPGGENCTTLITSRDRLDGLVTAHGAYPLTLDILPEPDARGVLTKRLGARRITDEAAATTEILRSCAGFPLALCIVSAQATVQPQLPLSALAAELSAAETRLGALEHDETGASLRTALSCSYAVLTPRQVEAFETLGLHLGPDISLRAVAALMDQPVEEVTAVLRELARLSLIQQHAPDRYRMHDLVRLYALEQSGPRDIRRGPLRRLIEFYVGTAYTAARLLDPSNPVIASPPKDLSRALPFAGDRAALKWLTSEHECLVAIQQFLAGFGWHTQLYQLAAAMTTFRWRQVRLNDQLEAWTSVLTAAEQTDDTAMQATARRIIGDAYLRLNRHDEAERSLCDALVLARRAGDLLKQADTERALNYLHNRLGAHDRASRHVQEALRLFRLLANPIWEGRALNDLGWTLIRMGQFDEGQGHCEIALTLARRHHDRSGEPVVLDSLGYAAHRTGRYVQATDFYRQALALYREHGQTWHEATTLDHLGQTYAALGRNKEARQIWHETLDLYESQLRAADREDLRRRLESLP